MRRFFLSIVILALAALRINAQVDSLDVEQGDVDIVADSAITRLELGSRKFKEVRGFRVQLFLGTLEEAKNERNKYLSLDLPYSAYIKQIVPEHALHIGDFTTRLELDKCLEELKEFYPSAVPVVTTIETTKMQNAIKPAR